MDRSKEYLLELKRESANLRKQLTVLRDFVNANHRIDQVTDDSSPYFNLHGGPYGDLNTLDTFYNVCSHPTVRIREEIAKLYPDAIPIRYFPQFIHGFYEPNTSRYRINPDECIPFLFYGQLDNFEDKGYYYSITISDPYITAVLRADKGISFDYLKKSLNKTVFCRIYFGEVGEDAPFIAEAVEDIISFGDAVAPDAFPDVDETEPMKF